jgi:hypothetical protein
MSLSVRKINDLEFAFTGERCFVFSKTETIIVNGKQFTNTEREGRYVNYDELFEQGKMQYFMPECLSFLGSPKLWYYEYNDSYQIGGLNVTNSDYFRNIMLLLKLMGFESNTSRSGGNYIFNQDYYFESNKFPYTIDCYAGSMVEIDLTFEQIIKYNLFGTSNLMLSDFGYTNPQKVKLFTPYSKENEFNNVDRLISFIEYRTHLLNQKLTN